MAAFPGSIAFDEFGKPFIILRDQGAQKRLTGNDAIKVSFSHGAMATSIYHHLQWMNLWIKSMTKCRPKNVTVCDY